MMSHELVDEEVTSESSLPVCQEPAVAHPETSPPVLWTGKMHSWTGWTGKKNGVFGSHIESFYLINYIIYSFFLFWCYYR